MSYEVETRGSGWVVVGPAVPAESSGMYTSRPRWRKPIIAACPTREAAEAARRLLSGECERAKEPEPLRGYLLGISDGAAQERARIVAFVRKRHRGTGLADLIERGEAGE